MKINLTLDIEKSEDRFTSIPETIVLRQNDAEAYELDVLLRQNSAVLNLTNKTVRFYALRPDGHRIIDGENVTVVSADAGEVTYSIPSELTEAVGEISHAYFRITEGEWSASTENIYIKVIAGVDSSLNPSDYLPELESILDEMEQLRTRWQATYMELVEALAEQIPEHEHSAEDITSGTIDMARIGDGTIPGSKLEDETITADKIAIGAIGQNQIALGAIHSGELASGSVTTSKIGAAAVGKDQLAENSVDGGKICANAVDTDEIAPGAVTENELSQELRDSISQCNVHIWFSNNGYLNIVGKDGYNVDRRVVIRNTGTVVSQMMVGDEWVNAS